MAKKKTASTPFPGVQAFAKPASYNPRVVSKRALAGLRESLRIFGDLSGFVWNERTGNIVCGHQRRQALDGVDLARAAWGESYQVELGYASSRFRSIEQLGVLTSPAGGRFSVRRVAWEMPFEKAANVAANNTETQGEFDPEQLASLVAEIHAQTIALPAALSFDELVDSLKLTPKNRASKTPPPLSPKKWIRFGVPIEHFETFRLAVAGVEAIPGVECEEDD